MAGLSRLRARSIGSSSNHATVHTCLLFEVACSTCGLVTSKWLQYRSTFLANIASWKPETCCTTQTGLGTKSPVSNTSYKVIFWHHLIELCYRLRRFVDWYPDPRVQQDAVAAEQLVLHLHPRHQQGAAQLGHVARWLPSTILCDWSWQLNTKQNHLKRVTMWPRLVCIPSHLEATDKEKV